MTVNRGYSRRRLAIEECTLNERDRFLGGRFTNLVERFRIADRLKMVDIHEYRHEHVISVVRITYLAAAPSLLRATIIQKGRFLVCFERVTLPSATPSKKGLLERASLNTAKLGRKNLSNLDYLVLFDRFSALLTT